MAEPDQKPDLTELFTNPNYGLVKQLPLGRNLAAVRDALNGWHEHRTFFYLGTFFDTLEAESGENENSFRQKLSEYLEGEDSRDLFLGTLANFLEDRDGRIKMQILARIFTALIRSEISKDSFYDLTFVLERMNARSISFLRRMGQDMGFEVRGSIDEYVDDGAILIAAGIASNEDSVLRVYPLGQQLFRYL